MLTRAIHGRHRRKGGREGGVNESTVPGSSSSTSSRYSAGPTPASCTNIYSGTGRGVVVRGTYAEGECEGPRATAVKGREGTRTAGVSRIIIFDSGECPIDVAVAIATLRPGFVSNSVDEAPIEDHDHDEDEETAITGGDFHRLSGPAWVDLNRHHDGPPTPARSPKAVSPPRRCDSTAHCSAYSSRL